MTVRAKFKCTQKTILENKAARVELVPVVNGSEENKTFYSYTPSGKIDLQTINPAAADQFEPGKEYYIDFILAN